MEFTGDDGRSYYRFRKMTVGTERGHQKEHGGKDSAKASAEHFGALKDIMGKLSWTFEHTEKQVEDWFSVGM